jgi:hypothetical protein
MKQNSQQTENFGHAGCFFNKNELLPFLANYGNSIVVLIPFILAWLVLIQATSILDEGIDGFDQPNFQSFSIEAIGPESREQSLDGFARSRLGNLARKVRWRSLC